jgi:hypothetical protein
LANPIRGIPPKNIFRYLPPGQADTGNNYFGHVTNIKLIETFQKEKTIQKIVI